MTGIYERYERHLARARGPLPPAAAPDFRMPAWLPASSDASILDLGCGFPARLLALYRLGFTDLHGVDLRAEAFTPVHGGFPPVLELRSGDMFRYLEEAVRPFDRILLFHVLEHLAKPDGLRLMSLAAARLKPGGAVVVEVPNVSNLLGIHTQASDLSHETPYNEFSLAQLLDLAGFHSTRVVCPVPAWRPTRPFQTTLGWRANRWLHRALFRITAAGPRPTCVCPALLMTASLETSA
jgi:SAM-dependent methyltransferase